MEEELKYTSGYDGATTDDLLGYAQEAKELKSNEYVRSMKEQLAAEDAETVQVYDVEGVPHKISKKELISKAGIQLPSLEEIGGFVAYDTNGQVLGLMSKEQVAQVVGGQLNIKGLKSKQQDNGVYLVGDGYKTGFILAYNKSDYDRNILVFFSIDKGNTVSYNKVAGTLEPAGGNSYGTFGVVGDDGSGNYLYSVIGF